MSELVTTKEMAQILGVNEKTFRKAIKEQNLPFHRIGNSRRFNPAKVLARTEMYEASVKTETRKLKSKPGEPSADKARFAEMLELK